MGDVTPVPTYGIDNLTKIASSAAAVLTIASKVFHSDYFALFGLIGPLNTLKSVDFDVVGKELGDLQGDERKAVQDAFVAQLKMVDPAVQAKIVGGVAYVDEAIALVGEGVALFNKGQDFVVRFKNFLGV